MDHPALRHCRFVFLLAVWLWCLIPLSPQSVDSDFWGHVQYGRDTLAHGLAKTATYTYTAVDYPWINHENLCEVVFAWFVDGPGIQWLLVFKCFLGAFVLGLAILQATRQRVSAPVIAGVCALSAWNLSYYWGLRPHMLSFTFFAVLIAWSEWCFAGWAAFWPFRWGASEDAQGRSLALSTGRLWGLWLALPLLIVWTNTHGGFAAGLAVFLAILSGRLAQSLYSTHPHRRMIAGHLLVLMVVAGLTSLVNPYGIELLRWLYYDVSTPRPEIAEWHPPNLLDAANLKMWLLLGATAVGWSATRRPRDLTQLLVGLLVLWQAFSHQRHFPFFVLLFLFWMPRHLESVWQRLRGSYEEAKRGPTAMDVAILRSASLGFATICVVFAYQLSGRFGHVPVPRNDYPVSAVEFMAQRGLTGRLIVSGHWAQYLLSVYGARTEADRGVRVAFDGRHRTCYPQEILDLQFDFFAGDGGPEKRYRSPQSPPADPTRILEFRQPELVLLGHHHQHALAALQQEKDNWTLLYQDELAQLWGRRSLFDQPHQSQFLPTEARRLERLSQNGSVPWPAAPTHTTQTTLISRPVDQNKNE